MKSSTPLGVVLLVTSHDLGLDLLGQDGGELQRVLLVESEHGLVDDLLRIADNSTLSQAYRDIEADLALVSF
jgi:hypothetical protein